MTEIFKIKLELKFTSEAERDETYDWLNDKIETHKSNLPSLSEDPLISASSQFEDTSSRSKRI